jgi:SAM-dependent methyltransferase
MDLPGIEVPGPAHRAALGRVLLRRAVTQGSITLPAVPDMLDEYERMCLDTFSALGVEFSVEQRAQLRGVLATQLREAFSASPRSEIVITYDCPVGAMVNYVVTPQSSSVQETYDRWVATREPPYFGSEPDARVLAIAQEHADPAQAPVLDVGAGTGRNSLVLARRGHRVDALELSREFAALLRAQAMEESLDVRVLQRDMFQPFHDLPRDYQLIVVSEVTPDFRSTAELERMFELAATCLATGGQLVVNVFLAKDRYVPDAAARQLGQQTYSAFFTREEVQAASADLPLELVDETPVYDYEREHLPAEAWPPTNWYESWVSGLDAFAVEREDSPIEMRWLIYRKVPVWRPTT